MKSVAQGIVIGAIIAARAYSQCPPPPPDSPTEGSIPQIVFDDHDNGPDTTPQFTALDHIRGLAVKTGDFNRDGNLDVVIGGNGNPLLHNPPVQVFYLDGNGGLIQTEALDVATGYQFTQACYGVAVGDVNEDGWDDIVVGRRNKAGLLATDNDKVFLNDTSEPLGGPPLYFDQATVKSIAYTATNAEATAELQDTFAIELGHLTLESPRHLDLVVATAGGFFVYTGNGQGDFAVDPGWPILDPNPNYRPGVYRNIELGDVNGDYMLDMVVSRSSPDVLQPVFDRVWINQTSVGSPQDPVFVGINPVIQRPPAIPYEWRVKSGCGPLVCGQCSSGPETTIDIDLGDLNDDGALDLVIACLNARNAVYLNDGTGKFGSTSAAADGMPHYEFASATGDWPDDTGAYESSQFLYEFCKWYEMSVLGNGDPFTGYTWDCIEFRVDGVLFDSTSQPWIDDLDRDGTPDVGFANRNDIHEIVLTNSLGLPNGPVSGFPYLSESTPAPLSYDHVYYKLPQQPGLPMQFKPCVELVGIPNDGTSYIEMVQIGGSGIRDWIESNFANEIVTDPVTGAHMLSHSMNTWIYYGMATPAPWQCVEYE